MLNSLQLISKTQYVYQSWRKNFENHLDYFDETLNVYNCT